MDTPGVQRTQARIVAVANQKSGNGKTTTAVNLASSLAASERRVLLVDMDPQANAGSGLGVIETGSNQNLYHVLMDGVPLSRVLVETRLDTLDVAPCSGDLVGAEVQWVSVASRGLRLQRALQSVSCHYDYIIIDSPSAFGVLTVNCLIAAHSVLIPVRAEYHALDGLGQLMTVVNLIQQGFNESLQIEGFLLTMRDPRRSMSRDVEAEMREAFGDKVFEVMIPSDPCLSRAASYGEPCLLYEASSVGALSYLELARVLISRAQLDTRMDGTVAEQRAGQQLENKRE